MFKYSKSKRIITVLGLIIMLVIGYMVLSTKFSYLETAYLTNSSDDIICVNTKETVIEEQFQMPYEILDSVAFQVGNYQRDSNSSWELTLSNEDGTIITSKIFGFYDAKDNDYYVIKFGKRIIVKRGAIYRLSIRALNVDEGNKIAFYKGYRTNSFSDSAQLYINGNRDSGILCMCINGSNQEPFWVCVYFIILVITAFILLRGSFLQDKGIWWYQDTIICSVLVGVIVFLICIPFASTKTTGVFIDETDNIRGGMIIAQGGVLYRDYVVQHPPVAYYLCSIFALFGANSVEQMRVMFYILLGIVWALMYARYHQSFGKRTMAVLPVAIILCTKSMFGSFSIMILSDVIQEMAMILLLLEFIYYCKDGKKLVGVKRCLIISSGVWMAFGSSFLSVYCLFFIVIGFLCIEWGIWRRQSLPVNRILPRYIPLICIGSIPLIAGVIYFGLNHSLYECYRQMYLFNREIYVKYQGMGRSVFEPFLSGLAAVLNQYVSGLMSIGGNTGISSYTVIAILSVTVYIVFAVKKVLEEKNLIIFFLILTLMICAGAARGAQGSHSLAFWGMLITWNIIFPAKEYQLFHFKKGIQSILLAAGLCLIAEPYVSAVTANFTIEQETVNYNDSLILSLTDPGEDIFIDAGCNDSIYLLTKGIYPINRAVYCLPWYMDWYEDWNIEDLQRTSPNIVVWNPDQAVWGRTSYFMKLNDYILGNYHQISDGSIIWRKNK